MSSFSGFDLDSRIIKGLSQLGWSLPTQVQLKVIPLALEGKDIVFRAKTGSGKTGAYAIPVIQKILKARQKEIDLQHKLSSVVLVPSKELCKQAYRNLLELSSYCSKDVTVLDIGNANVQNVKTLISNADIIISTPSKILAHINNGSIDLFNNLKLLVIDEADMMFSYGYENDINTIVTHLPKLYQSILVSATYSKDVENLKNLILHKPVIVKLEESEVPEEEQLKQFVIKCESSDKFLLMYSLFKLNLIQGKSLIFVSSIEKCYRLKLFFEAFYIKTCVLNAELPQNSRFHIVEQFNKGVYDTIIATDEAVAVDNNGTVPTQKGNKKSKLLDKEFSVSRGIDFHDIDTVINFDFPSTSEAYVHRIGRTARANNSGTALSFVANLQDQDNLINIEKKLANNVQGNVLLKPYNFKIDEIEGLRYRVNDAYNSVTRKKVKDARLKEIKGEILNSTKLKSYFEENPKDLKVLRHDKVLVPSKQKPHLKNIPDYLVPEVLKHVMLKPKRKRSKSIKFHEKRKRVKQNDPLKTFSLKSKVGG